MRREGTMSRDEFMLRQREFQPRGMDLPQTKLLPLQVAAIRSAQNQRKNLLTYIRENLSNKALAKQFGVHEATIEKVLSRQTWATEM